MISFPIVSSAYSLLSSNDPGGILKGSPYYNATKDEIRMDYVSGKVSHVTLVFNGTTTRNFDAPSGQHFVASGLTCVGVYDVTARDGASTVLATYSVRIDDGDLSSPKCDSSSAADTGTQDCDLCKLFSCPGWDEYMGKMDQISSAIPPPPNWGEVADTFRDSIAPRLVSDMEDMLGTAPDPPPDEPELGGIDDRGINDSQPNMQDVPGLNDAGFSADDIKNQAPVIKENPDPTDGFDLSVDPIGSLPAAPENPKPGATDAGGWGGNKPSGNDVPFPGAPKEQGGDVTSPPTPKGSATPPIPGGDSGSAPKPGGDAGPAPTPGGTGGGVPGMNDYKASPEAADGSGAPINP